jgi:NTP pyrophosphatase (non-canonical NTP hydrolase)
VRRSILTEFEELKISLKNFASLRNWEEFHTPKNLAMALASEAGELLAEFQWLTPEGSKGDVLTSSQLGAIKMEMADIFLYLLILADSLSVDLIDAARTKMSINEQRFPVVNP